MAATPGVFSMSDRRMDVWAAVLGSPLLSPPPTQFPKLRSVYDAGWERIFGKQRESEAVSHQDQWGAARWQRRGLMAQEHHVGDLRGQAPRRSPRCGMDGGSAGLALKGAMWSLHGELRPCPDCSGGPRAPPGASGVFVDSSRLQAASGRGARRVPAHAPGRPVASGAGRGAGACAVVSTSRRHWACVCMSPCVHEDVSVGTHVLAREGERVWAGHCWEHGAGDGGWAAGASSRSSRLQPRSSAGPPRPLCASAGLPRPRGPSCPGQSSSVQAASPKMSPPRPLPSLPLSFPPARTSHFSGSPPLPGGAGPGPARPSGRQSPAALPGPRPALPGAC